MRARRIDYSRFPQITGELFRAAQERGPFTDAKTFVDAELTVSPELLSERYRALCDDPTFDLREFLAHHFRLPDHVASAPDLPADRSMEEHIDLLWDHLTTEFPEPAPDAGSTLLSLPEPHVVPGGRFREMYYWDSYFIMEGLATAGRHEPIDGMVENVASLIDRFGFVPLGNRVYYDSRSQLPVFVYMLRLLEREHDTTAVDPYVDRLRTEYEFWMAGADEHLGGDRPTAHRRVVAPPAGPVLNRYWDDRATPRPEAYTHDRSIGDRVPTDERHQFFRDVRAACESGWDFSTRWLREPSDLRTIHTTDLLPVDLNATMYAVEAALAEWLPRIGEDAAAERFDDAASQRRDAVREYCWDPDRGFFVDYDWREGAPGDRPTLAGVVPLFTGLATQAQAEAVAETLETAFLESGGLVTTLTESGQQWDAPNGWAPLQWLAIVGLRRYGHDDLAATIADRWLAMNRDVFASTGLMAEKYDVQSASTPADSGEYTLQYGFGWTNGVALALEALPDESVHPPVSATQ